MAKGETQGRTSHGRLLTGTRVGGKTRRTAYSPGSGQRLPSGNLKR